MKGRFQLLTKYNLSSSESRVKSKFKDKGLKWIIPIATKEFQMSFQRQ